MVKVLCKPMEYRVDLEEGVAVASHRTPLVVPALKAVQAALGISKVEMLFAPPLEQVVVDLVSQEDLVPPVWLAMVAMGISSHSLQQCLLGSQAEEPAR